MRLAFILVALVLFLVAVAAGFASLREQRRAPRYERGTPPAAQGPAEDRRNRMGTLAMICALLCAVACIAAAFRT